uniref:Uncharacterized protein n=1 Tax=Setaria italica TaxID=4555 RepID=K3YXK0_SETIT
MYSSGKQIKGIHSQIDRSHCFALCSTPAIDPSDRASSVLLSPDPRRWTLRKAKVTRWR